jgi:hypothetical protein
VDVGRVRALAEAHGRAMAEGNLRRAASDLDDAARAQSAEVMRAVPRSIDIAEVTSVEASGGNVVVRTHYAGGGAEATVEARWEERDGHPRIVDLRVV